MKRFLLSVFLLAGLTGCTSISKSRVGGKEVVQVTKIGVQILNKGGAPVQSCVTELSSQNAKTVVEAGGAATNGLFGLTRSIGITGVDVCNAVGTK